MQNDVRIDTFPVKYFHLSEKITTFVIVFIYIMCARCSFSSQDDVTVGTLIDMGNTHNVGTKINYINGRQ